MFLGNARRLKKYFVYRYKGHTIMVKRNRSPMMSTDYGSRPFETLSLSTWGRNRHILNEILEAGKKIVKFCLRLIFVVILSVNIKC